MKFRHLISFVFFISSCFALSAEEVKIYEPKDEIPECLQGMWQGSDRLLLFSGEEKDFFAVLRMFYRWYDDRAAEKAGYKEIKTRDRNDTTSRNAEDIDIKYITVVENQNHTAGVYELEVKYLGVKDKVYIPLAVINNNIYLDFLIKDRAAETDSGRIEKSDFDENKLVLSGFYRDASSALGITVSPPVYKKELLSYFIDGNSIYHIRYWQSKMEYSYETASFSDGEKTFNVDKFLRVGGKVYQCTTGRSTKIRNIQKSSSDLQIVCDEDGIIIALGKPYLTLVPETKNFEQLSQRVTSDNSRRSPPPKPLFPVPEIKYRWKEITELELYDPYTWNRRNIDIHK